jgi:hypothetical protein
MIAPWVEEEVKTARLNDKRLNERLAAVLSQLAARPTASIPAACGGRAEMVAAYRFCENEKTSFEAVLQPHCDATRQRMASQCVVILAQDTTEIDATRPDQQVTGAGPLDGGSRRGALLHALHAFTPDGTPLGTVHAAAWVREAEPVDARLSRAQQIARPIEEKESYRWVATLQQAREEARCCPATQFICVADSEADLYEVLVQGTAQPGHGDWIVRACQDRARLGENGENAGENHVRQHVFGQPVLFENTIHVRGRKKAKVVCSTRGRSQPRETRDAQVVVRAARVTLRPPWRADRKLPPVTVNVVLVSEVDPPPGDEPVEWFLLSSLPIDSVEQVRQIIQYYCVRWMIELFFRVLKSGCRVEERLFEYMDRLLTCLAVYMIVAWRTLYVCRLGRSCPETSCEVVFEPAEWKSVWKVVRREDPPAEPPPLGVFVRMVAQLGGYVNRKRPDPPGPQTVWIGLQRMHDFATCWQLFGPEAQAASLTCV